MLPPRPSIANYDTLAQRWLTEVVQPRRHRTTKRVIAEAWHEEQRLLAPVPQHLVQRLVGDDVVRPVLHLVDASQRQLGEEVDVRPLSDYEVAL